MDKLKDHPTFASGSPVVMLGVPFDNLTMGETLAAIDQMIASGRPHYLATANVDFLVQSMRDVELRRILFDAHLILCDGTPLVWASKLLGNPLPERIAGSDLVPLLLKKAEEKGYRPFLLGATPETLDEAVARIKQLHPNLKLAGYYSPPFNQLLEMDHAEITRRIQEAEPDLLLVGFGCPKQEKWINMHYRSLGVPVSIGVGGTIDFLAGKLVRAPIWMQKTGSEWIFRLAQEPRRLLSRYVKDLWHFGRGISAQYLRLRFAQGKSSSPGRELPVAKAVDYNLVAMPERVDFEMVQRERAILESAIAADRACLLELGSVEFIDSTGIGLLIRLQKKARANGRQFILVNPSICVSRALRLMKLEEFFISAPNLDSAAKSLQSDNFPEVRLKAVPTASFPVLAWSGEVTSANVDQVWTSTVNHLSARSMLQRSLVIDLADLDFIDSSGVGLMIRVRKLGASLGLKVIFTHPASTVLNVIRLSRLEEYLLKTE
jgi:N-acetylglucosaminyldiphosphoundecaprenol N-acetyl-beta-D-mannosaminyltransferase